MRLLRLMAWALGIAAGAATIAFVARLLRPEPPKSIYALPDTADSRVRVPDAQPLQPAQG